MPRLSPEKLAAKIEALAVDYEYAVAHQHDDLLASIEAAARTEKAAAALKVELTRRALRSQRAGAGPSRKAIAEAAQLTTQALYQTPYRDA